MQKPWPNHPDVKRLDPIWMQVRREAEETSAKEPVLASLIYAMILSEPSFEDAVCHRLAQRLEHSVDSGLLDKTFHGVLAIEPSLGDVFRADLLAVSKRDPACRRLIDPLLYFKRLPRARNASLRALPPEPFVAHPSSRHSSCGADRQRRDA
jgi:hypothetical protein